MAQELPIIQKAYDLIKWYAHILQRLPRKYLSISGDWVMVGLYGLLGALIWVRCTKYGVLAMALRNIFRSRFIEMFRDRGLNELFSG